MSLIFQAGDCPAHAKRLLVGRRSLSNKGCSREPRRPAFLVQATQRTCTGLVRSAVLAVPPCHTLTFRHPCALAGFENTLTRGFLSCGPRFLRALLATPSYTAEQRIPRSCHCVQRTSIAMARLLVLLRRPLAPAYIFWFYFLICGFLPLSARRVGHRRG